MAEEEAAEEEEEGFQCPQCENIFKEFVSTCPECGTEFEGVEEEEEEEEEERKAEKDEDKEDEK